MSSFGPTRRPPALKGTEADEAGNVGEIGDLQPGETKTLSLNLKAGHYALICNLPGHYKLGQHADLTVADRFARHAGTASMDGPLPTLVHLGRALAGPLSPAIRMCGADRHPFRP